MKVRPGIQLIWALSTITLSCQVSNKPLMIDESLSTKANALAQKYIIIDGHVDLPYRLQVSNFKLEKEFLGIPIESDEGDFDF